MRSLILLLLLCPIPAEQRAYMVWGDRDCPIKILPAPNARLEAPMKDDGTPDMSRAKLTNVPAEFIGKCGRIEIRRENDPQPKPLLPAK